MQLMCFQNNVFSFAVKNFYSNRKSIIEKVTIFEAYFLHNKETCFLLSYNFSLDNNYYVLVFFDILLLIAH